jgi:hypothetical protein
MKIAAIGVHMDLVSGLCNHKVRLDHAEGSGSASAYASQDDALTRWICVEKESFICRMDLLITHERD